MLWKLSKKDIEEATITKTNESKPKLAHPSSWRAKDIFAPATLHKDSSGQQPRFMFSTYMLAHRQKWKYSFCCAVQGCGKVFDSIRNWNSYHLYKHRSIRYRCRICRKWIGTPNRLRDHTYTHQEKKFNCGRCGKMFLFQSGLNLHRNIHRHVHSYECFAKDCAKKYKWPQDLLWHIKIHLKVLLKCEACDYWTHERCPLRQHKNVHSQDKKYICRKRCGLSFKHAMQCYQHKKK